MRKTNIPRGDVVREMVRILVERGYHDQDELFEMVHDLYPRHRLYDFEIRAIITGEKCR